MTTSAVGTVRMRDSGGRRSAITVSRLENGSVDIHFSRSAEGEALMRLPRFAAKELGKLLAKASEATP